MQSVRNGTTEPRDDLANLQFYFRTFSDQSMRSVDVRKALASAGSSVTYLPMETTQPTPITPVSP
ncbi:MAG: hypothetical protein WB609_00865 [Candidatus Cybelea sp.]